MWDVPRSLIFCNSCIVMLLGICCIYLPNPFFISPRTPITTRIVEAFTPTFFQFRFQGLYILKVFHLLELKCSFQWEWSCKWTGSFFSFLFLIPMSGLLALSHNLYALAYHTRLWCCLFLLLFGAHVRTISRFCLYSSLLLQLATWIMSLIFANARISGHISK